MKRTSAIFCIMLCLTQALSPPVSAFRAILPENAAVYGADLVGLAAKAETAYDGYLVALTDGAEENGLAPDGDWETVLPGVIRTDDLSLARSLLADGTAEYVETNDVVHLFDGEAEATNARDGWPYEVTDAAYADTLGLSGAGVRIAVIDSGVDTENADLRCAVMESGYDYVTDSAAKMCDTVGHGTQVIQMIAADRNDKGGTGIARSAVIVPLRCFAANSNATVATLARAIREAVDEYGCDIINMSWGLDTDNLVLHDAVRYAYQKGCILVAAAGNVDTYSPQGTVYYPAAYDEVIGVGAVSRTMEISGFSQRTAAVSVCAPGEAVPVWLGNGEGISDGTSFAAPMVSAMLALAKQRLPSLGGAGARQLVCERAVDRGAAGYDPAYGYGTIDVRSLLEQSWSYCRQEGGATVLSGWLSRPECQNIAALYRESGRMAACAFLPRQEGSGGFSCVFPGVTGELQYKLFCTERDYRPAKGFYPDNEGVTTP